MAELGPRAIAIELGRIGTQLRNIAAGLADGNQPTRREIATVETLTYRASFVIRGVDPK